MSSGFIRTLIADLSSINSYIFGDGSLPVGTINEKLISAEDENGMVRYWIGNTPETAADPDADLLYLLVNPETDEVQAFRTSANALSSGEAPTPVSLYLYRDSKSDRMEEEKYNVIFFDTPAGQLSIVKVITDVVAGRILEMPRPMRLKLRAFYLDDTGIPAYFIGNHLFLLNDGSDGEVSVLGGMYTAVYDGDTFESDYTKIEGIREGKPTVTIKKGQPMWPEWTDVDAAESIDGTVFHLMDGIWVREEEPVKADKKESDAA